LKKDLNKKKKDLDNNLNLNITIPQNLNVLSDTNKIDDIVNKILKVDKFISLFDDNEISKKHLDKLQ
jgi:hypothetical protein